MDDLLFISNYGEGEERNITFAHFSLQGEGAGLPSLKVLGWDNQDTPLHLDQVAKELVEHLSWPGDEGDLEAWRQQWGGAFTLGHREVISTAKELSLRLATLARAIRDRILGALAIETERGKLTRLMKAFQESLVHDLTPAGFADMYAQTIAYGLLSARIADPESKTAEDFSGHLRTNPFLRDLMETFIKVGGKRGKGEAAIDFDELGIGEVIELLDSPNTHMDAVLRDFGDKNPQEDPVIHFYEHFLAAYDKKQKVSRGVFYTPRPVVSYIVRSVDELLRSEFGLADGLADTTTWGEMASRNKDIKIPEGVSPDQGFVQILDPATGTGTFLVEVIDIIHKTLLAKWKGKSVKEIDRLWNEYVPSQLLPRLHGYELLMAPYAIAHLKVGLKLHETGYRFESEERARIYLTNALEPATDLQQGRLEAMLPALAHEAEAVNEVKRKRRFTVVVGNPPYSGVSANMDPYIRSTIDPYRFVDGKPIKEKGALQFEKNLNDDYVKFLRFAESRIELLCGIMGMVTNNAYLEAITLRGLRSHLLETFTKVIILDLHGDSDKREIAAEGRTDENVFEIKHGVAIALLARGSEVLNEKGRKGCARRADIKGSAQEKYQYLLNHREVFTIANSIIPRSPNYLFKKEDVNLAKEYECHTSVRELLGISSTGFESGRDEILTAFTKQELVDKILSFCTDRIESVRNQYSVAEGWGSVLLEKRKEIPKDPGFDNRFREFLFGPFDIRWCFYRKDLLKTNSFSAGKHLCYGKNVALVAMRQVSLDSGFSHIGVSRLIVNNRCFYSTKGKISYFPIFNYAGESDLVQAKGEYLGTNLNGIETRRWSEALGLRWVDILAYSESNKNTISSMEIAAFAYTVFHSPTYRSRYAEFLKSDFPRLPLPGSLPLFRELAALGEELVALHLLESPKVEDFITEYTGQCAPEIEKVSWSDETVWIDKTQSIGFRGVREEVWNFHVGGYQVCEKWLKDRKGRKLLAEDVRHYQRVVVALSETIRIMKEIDIVIERHGGWPGAFASGPVATIEGSATIEVPVRVYGEVAAEKEPGYGVGKEDSATHGGKR
ncbi:MAG: type ISP restriction/modification enzyme [Rectinemataceae bacterium]